MEKIKIFTQTPHSSIPGYKNHIEKIAKLSEMFNYTGILVTHSSSGLDPWVVALKLIQHTNSIQPLIAIQPETIPPITLAKKIVATRQLFNRGVSINVIGGTAQRLKQSSIEASNELRYNFLVEYIENVKEALASDIQDWDFGSRLADDKSNPDTIRLVTIVHISLLASGAAWQYNGEVNRGHDPWTSHTAASLLYFSRLTRLSVTKD